MRTNLRWQVGTGHFINVWKDQWILDNPNGLLQRRDLIPVDDNMLVAALITDGHWRLDPISHAIDPPQAQAIEQIPLPSTAQRDRLVWVGNKDSEYSVKKAYRLAGQSKCLKILAKIN